MRHGTRIRPIEKLNMAIPIFGFMGEFPGRADAGALRAYSDETLSRSSDRTEFRADEYHGCGGPEVAVDESIVLAVRGHYSFADSLKEQPSAERPSAGAVLAAYRKHGVSVLQGLYGSFALAIVDPRMKRTLLAIDRMGIERLAYSTGNHGIVFSTSAELVAKSPVIRAGTNIQALYDYLLLHMIPAPNTIFQGVHKLRAGSYALFENGELTVARYWTPRFSIGSDGRFADLKEQLHSSLYDAVASQIVDGESVGAFLSGGLDSSTISGVLSKTVDAPANTFSIGFGYEDYDELPYARVVNAHFGCKGHEYTIRGSDILETFPLIARAYDEPFGNSSALPAFYCARLARDNGVTHLLAGDGGDELFAGNSRYVEQRVFERYALLPEALRRGVLEKALSRWPASLRGTLIRKALGYIEKANTPLPDRLEAWNPLKLLRPADVLHPEFMAEISTGSPFEQMREVWASTPSEAYLHRLLYFDWQYTLADNDLRKVETMCALAGVRVSYPMLNHAVVDLSARIPPSLMMPGDKLRDFYKRSMRGFLPDAVIGKKKHGFGLPFGLWLKESAPLKEMIFSNLSDFRRRRILHSPFLDRLLNLHDNEDARYYGVFLWVIGMLEQWMREHRVAL